MADANNSNIELHDTLCALFERVYRLDYVTAYERSLKKVEDALGDFYAGGVLEILREQAANDVQAMLSIMEHLHQQLGCDDLWMPDYQERQAEGKAPGSYERSPFQDRIRAALRAKGGRIPRQQQEGQGNV